MQTPDWLILSITDNGPGHWYRFQIEGENLSAAPVDRRFCWSVRDVRDLRYAAHPDATPETVAAVHAAKQIAAR